LIGGVTLVKRAQLNKMIEIIEPVVQGQGFVVRNLQWHGHEQSLIIFIEPSKENAEKKVDLGDCEKVSRALSETELLDPMMADAYRLEVSSPGMEPPLRTLEHFQAAVGQEIEWVDGNKKKSSGILEKIFSESPLELQVQTKNGYNKSLAVDSLLYAKIKFDWDKLGESR